ncbi:MAG: ankyrin repeat domain-containing protein [Bryobacteraceae bacterium]|nr:ankyrin repeat domain-containing protein [Bryobacteraceae bacterium]
MSELLARQPGLLNASWDWGGGDWENGLEAAAHTGSREMALFLLEKGARLNVFAAAMLGYLDVVRHGAATPGFAVARGAHGIPLLTHALAGKDPARSVVAFLIEQGADVNAAASNGMTPLMMAVQTGQREAVKLLLEKGAAPNTKAANGKTALNLSLEAKLDDIAGDLRAAGASEF